MAVSDLPGSVNSFTLQDDERLLLIVVYKC